MKTKKQKEHVSLIQAFSKKFILPMLLFSISALNAYSQITINNTKTTNQLVTDLMGTGVSFSNASFQGVRNVSGRYQIGAFTTATTTQAQMGFTGGVVLTTGNTNDIPLTLGTNPGSVAQMSYNYPSCTTGEVRQGGSCPTVLNDLDILAGSVNYYNASILEFDFVPTGDSINFRYVFGSEEYSDQGGSINYQCSSYNDKFGFLISGPGIAGGAGYTSNARNIARLGNGAEVGINSVNNGVVGSSGGAPSAANCEAASLTAWVQNTPSPEYNGHIDGTHLNGNTDPLIAAQGGLTPGQTYHIKLLILDANDGAYDAVVYIEAGSFTSPTAFLNTTASPSLICSGNSTYVKTVVSSGTAPYNYSWSNGVNHLNSPNPSDSILVSPAATTTYTVTVVDNHLPTPTTATSSITVTVTPLPTANISYSASSFCKSISSAQPVTLTGTNAFTGGSYSASPSGLAINASGAITPSTSNAGTYTVTYSIPAADGCGIVTATANVTISAPVTQNITGVSQLCAGLTNTFTASPTTGGTWSSSASGTASVDPSTGLVTGIAAGTATITYTVNTGSCVNTATQSITINSLPNVTATSNEIGNDVCLGGNITLTGGGASSYTWTGGITNGVSFAPSATTTYTVTGTDGNNCQNTAQITVTVNNLPVINVTGIALSNPSACLATDGQISGITVTGTPVFQYSWNGGTPQATSTLSGVGAGAYSLVVTDGNGCVSTTGPYSLSDPGAPAAPVINGLAGPVCEGNPITLSINNPNGAATYTWTGPSGALGTGASITIQNASLADAGSYSAQTTLAGCTGSSSSVTVVVTPLPTSTINYLDPFCSSSTVAQLVSQTGTGGGTFTANTSGLNLNSTTGDIIPSSSTPGTYVITYTIDASAGCPDVVSTDTIDITSLPSATINYSGSPFCSSLTSLQAVNQTGNNGGTYSSTAGLTINTVNGAITPSTSNAGTYSVTYTIPAANGCPSVSSLTNVTITSLPAATILYNGPLCSSQNTAENVILTGNTGGVFSTGIPGLSLNATTGVVLPSSSIAGSYVINYTIDSAAGCSSVTTTASVTINQLPSASISYSGSPFCSNLTVPQTVSLSGNSGGYFTSSNGLSIDSITGTIIPSQSSDGVYTIEYTIPASGGCSEVITTTTVTVVKTVTPVTGFSYTSPVCSNGINPLPIPVINFSTGGLYSSTSGLTIDSVNGTISLSTTLPGTYSVTYSIEPSGCTVAGNSATTIIIEPAVTPVTDFSYSIPVCIDDSSPFPVTGTGFTTGGTYAYSPEGLIIDQNTGQIGLSQSLQGSYTVTYSVPVLGCRLAGSSSTLVSINSEGCLNIPTAFSPNGDNENDTWEIEHIDLYDYVTIEIFNRWGQLMFEYSGPGSVYAEVKNRWDGKYNGKDLPLSSFIFIVNLHDDNKPIQGIVTIIR